MHSDPVALTAIVGGITFATVFVVQLTRIVTHLIDRKRAPAPRELAALGEHLQRIEQTVESTAIEVERISEGQRFTTRLLSERAGEAVAPTGAKRPS